MLSEPIKKMLWHSKEKQVKGFMLIQFAPALLLSKPKHKHASSSSSSSYWHLKDENAHQRMKVHETSSHFNRVSCRHTLYPSLLWCSGQAWRWSACCCCVRCVCVSPSLSLSAVWLLYFTLSCGGNTLERSLTDWRVLGGVGGCERERAGNLTRERALFNLKGDWHEENNVSWHVY